MRRFYHGRADDFETEELAAFMENVPGDSATIVNGSGLSPGTDMSLIMLAKIHDILLIQAYGNGSKKAPKKELLLSKILPEDEKKVKSRKASVEFWESRKELGFDDDDFFEPEKPKNDDIK